MQTLRHLIVTGAKPWEGIAERDKSEDLPSIYYEIVPAANGRVCDLRLSGLHTLEGATTTEGNENEERGRNRIIASQHHGTSHTAQSS